MENEKRYKVKEMADLLGMSTQTLRRYDDLGIIFPERGDDNDLPVLQNVGHDPAFAAAKP